ncbi:MAG: sigma-54-dependent Fis family transcriptional regulator [Calditrichaeota bacterium]|nr:sigma-54-dependent Fis family transcriptional regulator [Calditrichota bacterium]RQW05633.1 MAG: sigma-54-dependent Fis family transcriptional regulator [Calditrichota bacterium]
MFSERKVRILLIEDEDYDVRRIKNTIKPFNDRIILKKIVASGESALAVLEQDKSDYDVVIMDFQIAGRLSGESLIQKIKQIDSSIQIIVVTKMTINITDFEFANRLIEAGAMWYCTKYPGDIEDFIYQPTDFILSIFNAAEKRNLEKEKQKSQKRLDQSIHNILENKQLIGKSDAMARLRDEISKASQTDAAVFIQGASGTGKELVATHIHYLSRRRFDNFIPINCGSLPHELIESELFGFERGSFTGAQAGKAGLFEVANNGTAFLDEIIELPASAQSKLLRFLQEGEIDKIGRTRPVKVNVRIIAATNKNIPEEINAKKFREDLFYRLNVFPIWVPQLKERTEDIPALVNYFMLRFSRDMSREKPVLSEKGMDILRNYDWPGNVRELQNVIQRLILKSDSLISDRNVSDALGSAQGFSGQRDQGYLLQWDAKKIQPLKEVEAGIRKKYFQFVRKHSSSDAEAARKLGLAPPNYYRMCKELGIK